MNLGGLFVADVFRTIVTVLVPGALATIPYILVLGTYQDGVKQWASDVPGSAVFVSLLAFIAVGLLVEGLGSWIEMTIDGIRSRTVAKEHNKRWDDYLKLEISDEFVGQRYLRWLLTYFRFELNLNVALWVGYIGLLWYCRCLEQAVFSAAGHGILTWIVIGLSVLLLVDSFHTSSGLDKTRKIVISAAEERSKRLEAAAKQKN